MSYSVDRLVGTVEPSLERGEAILERVEKTQLAANLRCHCCGLMQGRTDEIVIAEALQIAVLAAIHARIVRIEDIPFEIDVVRVEPEFVPWMVLRSLRVRIGRRKPVVDRLEHSQVIAPRFAGCEVAFELA